MILIHDYIIRELRSTKKGKGLWVDPIETYIMKYINDIVIFANKKNDFLSTHDHGFFVGNLKHNPK